MNVGELKKVLANLPDDMTITIEVSHNDGDDIAQGDLKSADVECRCDEVDRLYLWAADDDCICDDGSGVAEGEVDTEASDG